MRIRRTRPGGVALLAAAAMAVTACGTSLDRAEIERGAGLRSNGAGLLEGGDAAITGDPTGESAVDGGPDAVQGSVGGATGSGGGTSSGATGPDAAVSGGAAPGAGSGGSGGAGGSGTTAGATSGPPVVIASVGTMSGVTGEAVKGVTEAVQAWSGMINDAGGLGGRPVKLIVADDGGDSNRHLQLIKQMVEQYKVIAFVGNPQITTQSQQAIDYLESKGIPTVGDDSANAFSYKSPMIFPAVTSAEYYAVAGSFGYARLAKQAGLKKIALITCVEASVCQQSFSNFEKDMARVGLEPVYKAQTSVTQPDFTAQCIAARNAGAELLRVGMDFNSVRRVITSCHQQGYRPRIITSAVADNMEKEAIWQDAIIGWMSFSPYSTDTPALREFRGAMDRYAKRVGLNLEHPIGWSAAKLFQRSVALAQVAPGKAVTKVDVVRGLHAMKGETLGGLTGPLTYRKGKPATPVFCFISLTIKDKRFVAPNGPTPSCQPPPRL